MSKVSVESLMATSGVKFGTSGARGLASAMTDRVCYAYTTAFLQHLQQRRAIDPATRVAIAGDRRPSTPRIVRAVDAAVRAAGHQPVHCGQVPSPTVALFGLQERIPSVMVTGSHIPADRNGIKFNGPTGEILKEDEVGIRAQEVELGTRFTESDALASAHAPERVKYDERATRRYVERYVEAFGLGCLLGCRVGLYEHSAVGREILHELLTSLGAEVVRLGASESFVPVDTEAVRDADVDLAKRWASEHRLDAIVSTDGDSDRPLVSDEKGRWLRGDVAGILTARFVGARTVVVPVSCNTAVERSALFERVLRTRIGSPYVIEAMAEARAAGSSAVVGYEANGGFLTADDLELRGGRLQALPTRDAVVVILALLVGASERGLPLSALVAELPGRFTASDRIQAFPSERSRDRLDSLLSGGPPAVAALFDGQLGEVTALDSTDGLRVTFQSQDVLHFRASGNAPELRCYSEANSEERARWLVRAALAVLERWR